MDQLGSTFRKLSGIVTLVRFTDVLIGNIFKDSVDELGPLIDELQADRPNKPIGAKSLSRSSG